MQTGDARPNRRTASPLRRLAMWLLMLALVGSVIEGLALASYRFIVVPRVGLLIWNPDIAQVRAAFAAEPAPADEELVWPLDPTAPPRDRSGAKLNADYPTPGGACISAYGDSFIWGDDVPPADGWIEQLSRRIGCRIANYGVGGYGTDQAYLRFRKTAADEAPVVILGIFPENLMRNVNQYRSFLGWTLQPSFLKGRFILDPDGKLAWIPRPHLGLDEVTALHRTPAAVVPHEYLLPDSRDGPVTLRFSYTLALARVALLPGLRETLLGKPLWSDYFRDSHPSAALPLTVALAEAFARESDRRGKRPLVIILPSASSFRAQARYGAFEYGPLLAALSAKRIDVIDGGNALLAALGGGNYCMLFAMPDSCSGHYGRDGGGLLATVVRDALVGRGLIRP
jgi:hypothetical protein